MSLRTAKTISTHTLTWSVTENEDRKMQENRHFNSHAHVERDQHIVECSVVVAISTHTLTWSVTETMSILCYYYGNFNSHAHVERDTSLSPLDLQ